MILAVYLLLTLTCVMASAVALLYPLFARRAAVENPARLWSARAATFFVGLVIGLLHANVSLAARWANVLAFLGLGVSLWFAGRFVQRLGPQLVGGVLCGLVWLGVTLLGLYVVSWLYNSPVPERVGVREFCGVVSFWGGARDMPERLRIYRRTGIFDERVVEVMLFNGKIFQAEPDTPASRALLSRCRN